MNKYRDNTIDFIKGIAMTAIVFYHLGLIQNGYLGVDVFLVINGYLIMAGVLRHKEGIKGFSLFNFMIKRVARLQPVLLAGCISAMLLGYFVMLPDDYEGLAETAVASVCGANNILQAITTHNYWDAVQDYKPLMHTWYLGVILQFYLVYGVYTYIVGRFCRSDKRVYMGGLTVLTVLSFVLYVIPGDPANKFYYLQYRFWELGVGALLALALKERKFWLDNNRAGKIVYGSVIVMLVLLFLPYGEIPKQTGLVLMILCSLAALSVLDAYKKKQANNRIAGGGM